MPAVRQKLHLSSCADFRNPTLLHVLESHRKVCCHEFGDHDSHLSSRCRFFCDMRTTGLQPRFDMQFISWTKAGYEAVLRGVFERIREGEHQFRPGEETAFGVIEPRLRNTRPCSSWVREPRTDGIRAYDGKNWHSGRQLILYWLRNLQRHLIGSPYFRASTA